MSIEIALDDKDDAFGWNLLDFPAFPLAGIPKAAIVISIGAGSHDSARVMRGATATATLPPEETGRCIRSTVRSACRERLQ